MKQITVFTPTYNRAYTLPQLYNSLVSQTNNDFIWLVIDDGSSDNTKELIGQWQSEKKISIEYIYQDNQGMHGAHNTAYKNINTELNVCIDSDDYMPNDAIEIILFLWNRDNNDKIAGILGLDIDQHGKLIGTNFPKNLRTCKYSELKQKHNVVGDKKFIYKTSIIKQYPEYPIFKGEKFVPLGYKYMLIDQEYDLLCYNEVLCIVEYQIDGSSKTIIEQYKKYPKGFAHERKVRMIYSYTLKERFQNAVHYISSSLLSKNKKFITESTNKTLTILAIPFGIMAYFYIKNTNRKGVMK